MRISLNKVNTLSSVGGVVYRTLGKSLGGLAICRVVVGITLLPVVFYFP